MCQCNTCRRTDTSTYVGMSADGTDETTKRTAEFAEETTKRTGNVDLSWDRHLALLHPGIKTRCAVRNECIPGKFRFSVHDMVRS
jgi:hypothetical protein